MPNFEGTFSKNLYRQQILVKSNAPKDHDDRKKTVFKTEDGDVLHFRWVEGKHKDLIREKLRFTRLCKGFINTDELIQEKDNERRLFSVQSASTASEVSTKEFQSKYPHASDECKADIALANLVFANSDHDFTDSYGYGHNVRLNEDGTYYLFDNHSEPFGYILNNRQVKIEDVLAKLPIEVMELVITKAADMYKFYVSGDGKSLFLHIMASCDGKPLKNIKQGRLNEFEEEYTAFIQILKNTSNFRKID